MGLEGVVAIIWPRNRASPIPTNAAASTIFTVTSPQGEFDTLAVDTPAAGQATLTFRNGTKYIFENAANLKSAVNVTARLKQIADPWGNQLNLAYDGNGRLSTVKDNLGISGRTGLVFTYDAAGKLSRVTDWTGRQWNYVVSAGGDLTSYTNPLTQQTRYTYATGTHNLFEIIKPLQRGGQDVKMAFKYYQNGRAFNYADTLGNAETLDYDLCRKTTRVTDPRGGIREYQYDESGRMTKLIEPDGAMLLFANNTGDGLRFKKTNGLGYVTQYSYRTDKSFNTASDTFGNVTREQDALSNTVDTTYGPYDQIATVKDKRGAIRTTSFHASTDGTCATTGKPNQVSLSTLTPASGAAVSNVALQAFCWNSDGSLKSAKDYLTPGNTTRARTTTLNYDAAHLNVLSVAQTGTDGSSVTRSFTYDSLGRKLTETLQRRTSPTNAALLSLTTTYTYDAPDRVTRVEDAIGNRFDTVYDANGQVYQIIGRYKQPDNSYVVRNLSTRGYDAADRMVSDTDVYNNTMQYRYDQSGNLLASIDPYQHTTKYEYDAMNRRTVIVDANGNRTKTVYDLAGQVKQVINANGETLTNAYDALGRLTQVTDPLGYITQYQYDANGNLTCRIDANAQAGLQPKNTNGCTEFKTYDELNRATQVKDALNGITKTSYDLLSNLISITDATNKATSFGYDDLGRQTSSTDPLGKTATLTRDQAGNVYQVTNRLGQITQVTFDNLNRPTTTNYLTDSTSETIGYDIFGNKQTASNGTVSYGFTYDSKNRLLSKTDSRANKKLIFTYDAVDNMLSKTDYQNQTTDFQYDSANRLVSMSNKAYLKAMCQFDPAGRLLSRVLSNEARSVYAYNADGQLTSLLMTTANNANTVTNLSYTRDRVGNITTQSGIMGTGNNQTWNYSYDADYRLTTASGPATETYSYDSVGNRLTYNGSDYYEYFANSNRLKAIHAGSISGGILSSYTYDDEGRMLSQTGTYRSSIAKTFSWDRKNRVKQINAVTMNYDPMDYRIKRTNGAQSSDYYLEGEHLEAEYSNGQLQSKYLRGLSTDELVAGYTLTNGALTPSIYHHDALMSVTAATAHDGNTQQSLTYGAFGNLKSLTGSTTNRLRYTGRELDPDTNCYYYRARYYCAGEGFISEDPLGFAAGVNFYAYVNNNPVNGNDPSGLIDYGKATQAFIDIASGGSGVFTGGVQVIAGAGLIAAPEPVLTKVGGAALVTLGTANLANSSVSLVNGTQNLISALRDEPANLPSSGLSLAASTFFPGNTTANNLATVADLSLAFVSGRSGWQRESLCGQCVCTNDRRNTQ